MKSRTLVTVLLSLQICLIAVDCSIDDEEQATPSPSIDEHKVLLECQHPDYRTYIKCLKRQKRHHLHNEHEGDGGETRRCFEDCGMEQCNSTKCVHDCHKHCMKKTKETRQIITQYETTCLSDDCDEKTKTGQGPANITTNIDINNVIHNHIPTNEGGSSGSGSGGSGGSGGGSGGGKPGGSGGSGGTGSGNGPNGGSGGGAGGGGGSGGGGVGGGNGCIPGSGCGPNSGWFGTGLTLVPQIQLVPQITFGLGLNSFGGGFFQPGGIDCSPCSNPFLRYRCDVSCYHVQDSNPMNRNTGNENMPTGGCRSPHCVGGN